MIFYPFKQTYRLMFNTLNMNKVSFIKFFSKGIFIVKKLFSIKIDKK